MSFKYIVIFYMVNNEPTCKLGLAVGKKVGGAVHRNRVKRLIREGFRRTLSDLNDDLSELFDVVIVAKNNSKSATFDAMLADMTVFFKILKKRSSVV